MKTPIKLLKTQEEDNVAIVVDQEGLDKETCIDENLILQQFVHDKMVK